MLQSYKGILHGNRIEWSADGGPDISADRPTPVEVTLIGGESKKDQMERGKQMAMALKKLAAAGTFDAIIDPVEWQREQRADRVLPGRDE